MFKDKDNVWKQKYKEECKRLKQKQGMHENRPSMRKIVMAGVVCAVVGGILSSAATLMFLAGALKFFDLDVLRLKPEKIIEKEYTGEIKEYTSPGAAVYDKASVSIAGVKVNYSQSSSIWEIYPRNNNEATGIIYSDDGYIITNYNVIQNALLADGTLDPDASVEVYINSGEEGNNMYKAEIAGYNAAADMALLKINAKGLKEMEMGSSDNIATGQDIFVIGCNSGMSEENIGFSINSGLLCDLNREIYTEQQGSIKLIQTNAVLNTGTLGGAVLDGQGKLIGINSSKITTQIYTGMSFAVPVNKVIEICRDILEMDLVLK